MTLLPMCGELQLSLRHAASWQQPQWVISLSSWEDIQSLMAILIEWISTTAALIHGALPHSLKHVKGWQPQSSMLMLSLLEDASRQVAPVVPSPTWWI